MPTIFVWTRSPHTYRRGQAPESPSHNSKKQPTQEPAEQGRLIQSKHNIDNILEEFRGADRGAI